MKTMKKLGAIMLVLAMCTMLMTLVSAVSLSGAVYSAASDKEIYCPSDEVQYITVTVKPDQTIDLASFDAYVLVPAGWSIVSIENDDLTLFEEAIKPAENRIMWFALVPSTETESRWTLENHTTDVLAKITYKVPANAEENAYTVGLTNVELMKNKATDGHLDPDVYVGTEENPVTITTTVTIGHTWEIEYRDNGDGTHTAYEACACGQTKGDGVTTAHDFTNGECICGAVETAQNVTVIHKGAALANAYTVDGQVVTVEFDKACKVGYWDETAGKYIALAANKISDNEYEFTAPAGVTEVLLVVKGDVNGNGSVNVLDKNILGKSILPKANDYYQALNETWQIFAADVNCNGSVNVLDKNILGKSILPKANEYYQALTW